MNVKFMLIGLFSGVTLNPALPCRKHHMEAPAPATSFVNLCLLLFLLRFCHLYILGGISSINMAFILVDR